MINFEHVNAATVASAVKMLSSNGNSKPIAGGTDLLTQMKVGIVEPRRLVNLKTIPGLSVIHFHEEDGLELGALATLNSIAENETVKGKYAALHQAVSAAASPQLRDFGTIGGNLVQGSRCWYYRGTFHCWLKGGHHCYAQDGENSHHAIFDGGPCHTVQPSDPACALMALNAVATVLGHTGRRTLPLSKLFQKPARDSRQLTALKAHELIVGLHVPVPAAHSRSVYVKAMDRKAWAFALASVAANLTFSDGVVKDARIVLGGVSSMPWRAAAVEDFIKGKQLSEISVVEAARLAVKGATPLARNVYKVALVRGLVTQALADLMPSVE